MKKLNLKKDVVSVLENETLRFVYGGGDDPGTAGITCPGPITIGVSCGNVCGGTSGLCGNLNSINICSIESGDDDSKVIDDCPEPQTDGCYQSITTCEEYTTSGTAEPGDGV